MFENIDKLQKYVVNLLKNNWKVMIALMIFFYFKDNEQKFDNQAVTETMFCIFGIETRFLHLILIFLLAGFHRNTSKSQTFSILNYYA